MAAARARLPGWRATPLAERLRSPARRRADRGARLRHRPPRWPSRSGKNRMEALGETQETADFFPATRPSSSATRLRPRAARRPAPGLPLAQPQRAEALRRLGGDRALQLPARARRRAGGGGAGHRQHRRVQGRDRHAVGRTPAGRLHPRRGLAGRRLQLRHGPRPRRRRGAGRAIPAWPASPSPVRTTSACASTAAMAGGRWPRPCIAEMGGKNACIVTARGDLDRAATGIVRSAFGLSGQKCSALSRVYVEKRGGRRARREARGADARAQRRRSDPARELDGAGDQRAAARRATSDCCDSSRPGGRISSAASGSTRRRSRPRPLRRADGGRGAARITPCCSEEMFLPIVMVAGWGTCARASRSRTRARSA